MEDRAGGGAATVNVKPRSLGAWFRLHATSKNHPKGGKKKEGEGERRKEKGERRKEI